MRDLEHDDGDSVVALEHDDGDGVGVLEHDDGVRDL